MNTPETPGKGSDARSGLQTFGIFKAALIALMTVLPVGVGATTASLPFGNDFAINMSLPDMTDFGLGNINNDGLADLVVLNGRTFNQEFSIYLGTPNGWIDNQPLTFSPNSTDRLDNFLLADVTGNGVDDIVAWGVGSSTLWIFPGSPIDGFGPGTSINLSGWIKSVHKFDYNFNNRVDLVILADDGIHVRFDEFGQTSPLEGFDYLPRPSAPSRIAVGRINGDSLPDLVAVHPDSLEILLRIPGGSFVSSQVELPPSSTIFDLAIVDVDEDAYNDLAVVFQGGTRMEFLLNDRTGGFSYSNRIVFPNSSLNMLGLHPFPFDLGDGRNDLVISGPWSITHLPLNTGSPLQLGGSFGLRTSKIQLAHLSGEDSAPTLFAMDPLANRLIMARPGNRSLFEGIQSVYLAQTTPPSNHVIGDFSGNGFPDMAIINPASPDLLINVIEGDGARGLINGQRIFWGPPNWTDGNLRLMASDLDKNGMMDLVIARDGAVAAYFQDTPGNFRGPVERQTGFGNMSGLGIANPISPDIDNIMQMHWRTSPSGAIFSGIYGVGIINQQEGTTLASGVAEYFFSSNSMRPESPIFVDLDGDGRKDIVFIDRDPATSLPVRVAWHDGINHWNLLPDSMPGFGFGAGSPDILDVHVADFTGNGHPDIVYLARNSPEIRLIPNLGNRNFENPMASQFVEPGRPQGDMWKASALSDLNGDGLPNLLVYQENQNIQVVGRDMEYLLFGPLGSGQFELLGRGPSGGPIDQIVIGDLDKDGKPDMIARDSGSGLYRYHINETPEVVRALQIGASSFLLVFSSPISGATMLPEHFSISGPGMGTLATQPDAVWMESTEVYLDWFDGAPASGQSVTIHAGRGVRDLAGRPVGFRNSATVLLDDLNPPTVTLSGDPTQVGPVLKIEYTAVDEQAISLVRIRARPPGATGFIETGVSSTGATGILEVPAFFGEDGTWEFQASATDASGNSSNFEDATFSALVNVIPNSAFSHLVTEDGSWLFPMESDLDIEFVFTGVTESFLVVVERFLGDHGTGTLRGSQLIDEHLEVLGTFQGANGTLIWPWDPASAMGMSQPVSMAFRANGSTILDRYPLDPVNPPVITLANLSAGGRFHAGTSNAESSESRGYSISLLGPGAPNMSRAMSVNEAGVIVGDFFDEAAQRYRAFRQGEIFEFIPEPMDAPGSIATSINNYGEVAGSIVNQSLYDGMAVWWNSDQTPEMLPSPNPGGRSNATMINDRGTIIGTYMNSVGVDFALRWESGNTPEPLSRVCRTQILPWSTTPVTYCATMSVASGINQRGDIVGTISTGLRSDRTPVRWNHPTGDTMTTPPAGFLPDGSLHAINDRRAMVGAQQIASTGFDRAVVWNLRGRGGMISLPLLPKGMWAQATDLNNLGDIVGTGDVSRNSGSQHGFLWNETDGMVDLNDLLPPDSGWIVTQATAINNRGVIVGVGEYNGHGPLAFRMEPFDEDGDGIPDYLENSDANNDGIPDSEQPHVARLHPANGSSPIVIISEPGTFLRAVSSVPDPSRGNTPAGYSLPFGFFSFEIHGVTPGSTTTLEIRTTRSTPPGYIKWNADTQQWENFADDGETGFLPSGPGVITLRLKDGGRGDSDGLSDGIIRDPGAITFDPASDHWILM